MALKGIVTALQEQGEREYQEDRMVHLPFSTIKHGRGHLLGIFDGHGGSKVSEYCAGVTPRIFNPLANSIPQELRRLVKELDVDTALAHEGSTVALACVLETLEEVHVATLGDSPIFIRDKKGSHCVSTPHNVRYNLGDRAQACKQGGWYNEKTGYLYQDNNRQGSGLQLTRALGDSKLRSILSRQPDTYNRQLSSQSVVLLCSDGLVGPESTAEPHTETAQECMIRKNKIDYLLDLASEKEGAQKLLAWRKRQPDMEDNVSLMIWRPKRWFEGWW